MTALQTFLFTPFLGTSAWLWLVFIVIVISLLVLDLGVLHRQDREIEMRESLLLYSGYFSVGVLFGVWVWYELGAQSALEFYTGFLVEQSLSMDNVFVMAMIFSFFAIPRRYQHRVLFWGILGVVVLRAIMIGVGAALVQHFAWVLYIFGAFLLFTGVKMALTKDDGHPDLANNPILRFVRRHMRVTDQLHGRHFFVHLTPPGTSKAVRYATPLFLALVLIELADLVFAVDSVPAIFAITQDPFIVYTSNIFAILGLRSLYFALAALMHRFVYLKYALALVLIFIGCKIFYHGLVGKVPAALSLGVTFGLLFGGVLLSLLRTRNQPPAATVQQAPAEPLPAKDEPACAPPADDDPEKKDPHLRV
ncbi:TerC family protein [Pseudomonas sp. GD03858]|uniref:TerC family protein n=1 Tax=unclassified Pseudomonas TaxID=196821 RepID=UPI00244CF921|nr:MULTISPECIES: TerC family protein [unclassified Pseudomonas]MDH0647953.1 TerC family protein [Pseudomonas sp. GD03867]MDH0662824.1 TerC family protein [Pseudomonas sp. GD03858]